ncbi:MAG TPA: hypothetical protein VNL73_06125 [Verrucomicrobiae bacterium]|nr:hypothetical protein [Verrucomicrobiae bacterium]
MANTEVQLEVEKWLRENWLPKQFGQKFYKKQRQLLSGGKFEFDAVSEDGNVLVTISTSHAKTVSGKGGSGKLQKIRADALFLLLSGAQSPVLVFTEQDMFDLCKKEHNKGRLPKNVDIRLVNDKEIPSDLRIQLLHARRSSSTEVSPTRPS